MNEYVDIGANLTHKSFRKDRGAVVERGCAAGVQSIVITGTTMAGSQEAAHLARSDTSGVLYATVGVHPHGAGQWRKTDLATARHLAKREGVVAIGECGLDYNRDFSPRAAQRRCFAEQLMLAAELQLPVFLHERDACDDFLDILREHWEELPRAVVHCFTGSEQTLERYLDLGAHIGITGWLCDERRGRHLRSIVRLVPPERLMIETDAPFLTPRTMPGRPRRNEPAFLPWVARAVAEVTGRTAEQVALETTTTARLFFELDKTAQQQERTSWDGRDSI